MVRNDCRPMSISSRIVKKKTPTNASLEVLSWDNQTSSPSSLPKAPWKNPLGLSMETLSPEKTAPSSCHSLPLVQNTPSRRRKVSTAPSCPTPVAPLSCTYPASHLKQRRTTADFIPGEEFDRRRAGKGIQEAKEFCVDMGANGADDETFEGAEEELLESDDDVEPWNDQEREELDLESLADDPTVLEREQAAATPRLTMQDISIIQDPDTLSFLAKNRATLAKYISLDSQSASRASTPAASESYGWTFLTKRRMSKSSVPILSRTHSDLLSIKTPSSFADEASCWPDTLLGEPDRCGLDEESADHLSIASPLSPHSLPDVLSPSLPDGSICWFQMDSCSPVLQAEASEEDAAGSDTEPAVENEESGQNTQPPLNDQGISVEAPTPNIQHPPRSYFGKGVPQPDGMKKRKKKNGTCTLNTSLKVRDTVAHHRLTEEEERRVKLIEEDSRYDVDEYVLHDGEGYSLSKADSEAMQQLEAKLAALSRQRSRIARADEPAPTAKHKTVRLDVVDRDQEAKFREQKEKANLFLQDMRDERSKGMQLMAIHHQLEALYQAEVESEPGELSPAKLQELLSAAIEEQDLANGVLEPSQDSVADPDLRFAADAEDPQTALEDGDETELSRRIAEARARHTERQTMSFDADAFWQEREQWTEDDMNNSEGSS